MQVILGICLGIFVLTQTLPSQEIKSAKDNTEQSDNSQSEVQLKITEAIPSSSVEINLEFQSFLLEELELDEKKNDLKSPLDITLSTSQKALKVILTRIISPNAP